MQEENYGARWIYIALLILLVVIVFAWGIRAYEGVQTQGATGTANIEHMLENRTEYYATATASAD